MPRRSDKRERLVAAGQLLFHRHGAGNCSLNELAGESGVPLGNIYYYFKTKDELIAAVADYQLEAVVQLLGTLDALPTPAERLHAFIDDFTGRGRERAAYGCPVGTLCEEVHRLDTPAAPNAVAAFRAILDWIEQQFLELDFPRKQSRQHAVHTLAAIQGASVLAHAFGDPAMVRSEMQELWRWLRQVTETRPGQ